jgi:flagellar protein FlgJ
MGVMSTASLSSALSSGYDPTSAASSSDPRSLDAVKLAAKSGGQDPATIKKVAQQFESMFLSMMLKNMRTAMPGGDPLNSDATKMATDMYDQQIAQTLAKGKGMGLADSLVAQIQRAQGMSPDDVKAKNPDGSKSTLDGYSSGMPMSMTRLRALTPTVGADTSAASSTPAATSGGGTVHQGFVDRFLDAAKAAAEATGLPAKVILGQAALESGWGKHEVRDASGNGSHNLFGVKAPAGYTGPTVDAMTTEVVNGVAQKVVQKFKAYASYAESFIDYAKTVANNPRYEKAVQAAGDAVKFATEMGRSGYATDPNYGTKLAQVLTGPLSKLL